MGKKNHLSRYLALIAVFILASLSSAHLVYAQGTQPTTSAIELVGTITAIDTSAHTITVNALKIDVSSAEIPAGVKLAIGQIVMVEGTLLQDGSIAARQIKMSKVGIQPGEVEIVGVVESLNATQVVVNGQQIDISKAEIGKGVTVGVTVKVHATVGQTGVWMAREVDIFVQPVAANPAATPTEDGTATAPDEKEFELTGTLDQIGADFIVVSGQKFSTVGAEIKGQLVVGVLVKVHVTSTNAGLVAREVELAVKVDDELNDDNKPSASATKKGDDKGGKDDGSGNNTGGSSGQGGGHDDGGGHDSGDDKGGSSGSD